jgi:hypothetical protein
MRQERLQQGQGLVLDRSLDETLIQSGFADLVPRRRRGHTPLALKLALLLVALAGVAGLPLLGTMLSLVVALVIEAISTYRQPYTSLERALIRTPLWERIRSPLIWTMSVGVGLVSLLHAGEPLWTALVRAGIVWASLQALADTVNHPERYTSLDRFLQWLRRLEGDVGRIWGLWLSTMALAILMSFAINVGAPGIWQAVGRSDWGRLLIFGLGVYGIAQIAFLRSSKSTVRAAVEETVQNWEAPKIWDLDRALRANQSTPSAAHSRSRYAPPLRERLKWKDVDNMVAHVGPTLEKILIRRVRRSTFLASASIFVVCLIFLMLAVFLIVPREVLANWVFPIPANEAEIILAFDHFGELFRTDFAIRLLGLDWASFAREPVPKLAFLEAALLVSFLLFRAATDRTALKMMAQADRAAMQRSFLLASAYLTLVEQGFQHLYTGFVSRRLTRNGAAKTLTLQNEVLLAPSAVARGSAYRIISSFAQLYGPLGGQIDAQLLAVFPHDRTAHEWTATFVTAVRPALAPEKPSDLDPRAYAAPGAIPEKFWIWSDDQLVDLSSFEEAQWYGRFVPQQEPP